MSVRCTTCGAEFPSTKGFGAQQLGKGRFRRLCPGCCLKLSESAVAFSLVCALLTSIAGAAVIAAWPEPVYGWVLLFLGAFMVSYVVCVVPHELGHALVASAVGNRLFSVTIGFSGRIAFEREFLGCRFVVRGVPLGGFVLDGPKSVHRARLRRFLTIAGGPLANVLLLLVAVWVMASIDHSAIADCAVAAFICANLARLAGSLFPRKVNAGGRLQGNDGLLMLQALRMKPPAIEAWHSLTFYYEAGKSIGRGDVAEAQRWVAQGVAVYPDCWWKPWAEAAILSHQGKYREARAAYMASVDEPKLGEKQQSYIWNHIAWEDLMTGDPTLLEEADRFSLQAIEADPSNSYFRGTRGCVLIELGRIDGGVPLVQQSLRESHQKGKASDACYLAIAERRRGNIAKSVKYLGLAKTFDPNCPLIERANRELESPALQVGESASQAESASDDQPAEAIEPVTSPPAARSSQLPLDQAES